DATISLADGFKADRVAFFLYSLVLAGTFGLFFGALVGSWRELSRLALQRWSSLDEPFNRTSAAAFPLLLFLWWIPLEWLNDRWAHLSTTKRIVTIAVYLGLPVGAYATVHLLARLRARAKLQGRACRLLCASGVIA